MPVAIPAAMPVALPIVAIEVLELDHVPPVIASLKVAVAPVHTEVAPLIGETGLTVIVFVAVVVLPQASVDVTV